MYGATNLIRDPENPQHFKIVPGPKFAEASHKTSQMWDKISPAGKCSIIGTAFTITGSAILINKAVNKLSDDYATPGWIMLIVGIIALVASCVIACRKK